jgi:cellulose synthase/poly-beta-1,6-N-acetylglucosamine synthase-like glycosyltransferase
MIGIDLCLAILALPALFAAGYLLTLALHAGSTAPQACSAVPTLRFDLIVPAHDEESGIARTVRSLRAVDYPADLRRVLVVADNCSDATAARAAAAGAQVLVRDQPALPGKGHALSFAFAESLEDGFADAVVVVDADSVAPPVLLRALAARIEQGAQAVQAGAAVLNPDDSWRTRLMALGLALFNGLRSQARENLDLSCGLRGNGMCLTTEVLRAHPPRTFSIVEDVEYGIALGRAGVRVRYAGEAAVASAMVSSEKAARSQRRRWDLGRMALARRLALPLLREALERRSRLLLDLAIDLLVPPLAFLSLFIAAGCAASALVGWLSGAWPGALTLWLASATCLLTYVLRGWRMSGIRWRGLSALVFAPFYVLWKLLLLTRDEGRAPREWVRTTREEALP